MSKGKRLQIPRCIPLAIVTLYPYFLVSCGGNSAAKKDIEAKKRELEQVEIEVVQLSQTPAERRVQVQTKGEMRGLRVAAQPDGVECEGETWGGIKGKCWASGDRESGESAKWVLVIRKDVQMRFGFLITSCESGLFMKSCQSETVYKDLVIKGP